LGHSICNRSTPHAAENGGFLIDSVGDCALAVTNDSSDEYQWQRGGREGGICGADGKVEIFGTTRSEI
jgi:hypothetical protein